MRRQQNSVMNQSGNVRASSSLHTSQEGWEGNQIQFWIRFEPILNQIWTSFESDLNQFWIRSESVLTQTWNVQPSCRRVLSLTGKWLPDFRETLPWHLIFAPRSHILEIGDHIDPLLRFFQKMKLTFSWSSRPSKAPKDLMHLARNPKMASNYIP